MLGDGFLVTWEALVDDFIFVPGLYFVEAFLSFVLLPTLVDLLLF
jgi:hypothetical protein